MNDEQMLAWIQQNADDFQLDLSTQDGREKLADVAYANGFRWDAGKGWTD